MTQPPSALLRGALTCPSVARYPATVLSAHTQKQRSVSECFLRLGGLFENQTLNPGSINAMRYQLTEKAKDLIHKSEILF